MRDLSILAIISIVCLGAVSQAGAGVLAYEPFDYSSGGLSGNGGTSDYGFSGAWTSSNFSVTAGSLAYPPGPSPAAPVGNKAFFAYSGTSGIRRFFASPIGDDEGAVTRYFSFLMTPKTVVQYWAALELIGADTQRFGCRVEGDGDHWYMSGATGQQSTGIDAVVDETKLLVVRIDFDGGSGADTVRLYVNPGASEPLTADATGSGNIGTLSQMRPYTAANAEWDEFYAGTSYGGVVPEPATLGLLALGGLALLHRRRRSASTHRKGQTIMNVQRLTLLLVLLLSFAAPAQAGIRADLSGDFVLDFTTTMDMPFMDVRNPGNAGDTEIMNDGTTGYGSVDYVYRMGKFEVTAGQYTEFLNAVAATDTYGLYNTSMWSSSYGCKIERTGSSGSYTYSVAPDWADRPVNWVSWGDSARFANWLTNGMLTGGQDLTTTEDGSYFLNGATSDAALLAVTREADARYVIPSEDEWYKAAYYDPSKPGGAGYWDYPTGSDAVPSNDLIDPDPGDNACFYDGDYTIGSPYWRTEAGEFENSESPYGTFDQGGNVWEWNEAILYGSYRGLRGGSFGNGGGTLHASYRYYGYYPTYEDYDIGFRVSEVPEPGSMAILALGCVVLLKRRKNVQG